MLKDHEKFIAFCLLGGAICGLTAFAMLHPTADVDSGTQRLLDAVMGALTLAFGGAANALFRITDTVKVQNAPNEPVPTTESKPAAITGELPESEKLP